MDEKEERQIIWQLSSDLRDRHTRKQQQLAEKNKREGEAFLALNKTKPGVHTQPSRLQYKVITEGSGASPTSNDLVMVKYRGTLLDGTEFINSDKHKPSPPISISGTKGWVEALQLMKPGAKWEVVIPAELAQGERGSYPLIPPNATLLYTIELVSVQPGPVPPPLPADALKVTSTEALSKGPPIEVAKPEQLNR
jgi:FKBP-type peptidyl-prolyl cis-trans isomerase FklB